MALVSQLAIEIAAKADKVKEGLSTAMQHVLSFASSAASIIGKAFSGIGGIIANIIKSAFDQMGDAQDRLTTLVGRSNYLATPVKDIQALDFAVNKAGGGIGSMDVAVRTMMKNVSQAVSGAGPAAQAIRDLGLNAGLLAKMNLTQQLGTIQVAVGKLQDQSKSKGILYQLFGESILPNIAVMNQGLAEQFTAFEKLGTGIDSSQEKIIRMNMVARTTFNEMKEGFINQFTIPFLDVMTQVIKAVQSFVEKSGGVKIAAATLAKGVLDIFQSVAQGLGGVEGVILRLDKALTNVLITYNKAKMMGSGLWDSTKALGQTLVNTVSRSIDNPTQPGWKTIKMGWDDAHSGINETASQAQQNIVELSTHLSGLDGKLKKIGDNAETVFSKPIATLDKYITDAKDPIKSLAKASVDAASNITRYTQNFTDAQVKVANTAEDLAKALDTASKNATTKIGSFESNPNFAGTEMDKIYKEYLAKENALQQDPSKEFKDAAIDAFKAIKDLKPGDNQAYVDSLMRDLRVSMLTAKTGPGMGTEKLQEVITDLQSYLTQKNLANSRVKVDVNLDMTDEMKKIIKVNGVYTDQETMNSLISMKSQNAVNTGLAAAAAAAFGN